MTDPNAAFETAFATSAGYVLGVGLALIFVVGLAWLGYLTLICPFVSGDSK